MFDLETLDTSRTAEHGAEMVVRHPVDGTPLKDGDGNLMVIGLAGIDSERHRRAEQSVADRRARASQQGRRLMSAAELDEDVLDVLATCTLWWKGFSVGGEQIDCNKANAVKLYQRFAFIREQAETYRRDRANFLPPSSGTL